MVCTLPGYPLCENFNKTGFLVVCSIFYLTDVMKFPIESSFPCYYGIRNERSSDFNLHNQILSFTEQILHWKKYILYLFNWFVFVTFKLLSIVRWLNKLVNSQYIQYITNTTNNCDISRLVVSTRRPPYTIRMLLFAIKIVIVTIDCKYNS